MVFVPPTWFEGMLLYGVYHILPFIILLISIFYGMYKITMDESKKGVIIIIIGIILCAGTSIGANYLWHENMEVPSVQEKIITVQEWQPKVGIIPNENGIISINSANDLMLVDTEGNTYINEENFWFNKFNTRDIFNQLKVNGTYKIKYYGWRNGYNDGFPNLLSIEQVIDENNTKSVKYSDYFGARLTVK